MAAWSRALERHDEPVPMHMQPTARASLRPTAMLLWESCRRLPRSAALAAAFADGAEPSLAVAAAIDHRIAPLLWRALSDAGLADDLGPAADDLRAVFDVYRMEGHLLLPRAVELAIAPLTQGGLEPVVLKGPALAARYPDPGLRPMEDIDLLLPKEQHVRALQLLRQTGWTTARAAGTDSYDTALTHPDAPSLALELHYALESSSQRVTALDPESLWGLRQPINCLGTAAFGLPLPHELVYLSAHAGKPHHGFFRLIWTADLAHVIAVELEQGRAVDWDAVRTAAVTAQCRTVVAGALALAAHAGVESPTDLRTLPQKGWRGAAFRQLTDVTWPLTHLELPGYHLNYALADTRWRRLRILLVLRGSGYGIGRKLRRALATVGLGRRSAAEAPVGEAAG